MKKIAPHLLLLCLTGCAVKPIPLPQYPYPYNKQHSMAYHYANAMGINNVIDLPKGEAEKLLKQHEKTMIEAGLSGYVVSFALASLLGFPISASHDLATDKMGEQFILGTSGKKKTLRDFDNMAIYLPYDLANTPETARHYVFDFFTNAMKSIGLELQEVDTELEYGMGSPFDHPLCHKLNTNCQYQIYVKQPVIGYAPEKMGGYKAWIWSPASRNTPGISLYNVAKFSQIISFDVKTIKNNQKAIQNSFIKPLLKQYPKWAITYKTATFNKAPFILFNKKEYLFEY